MTKAEKVTRLRNALAVVLAGCIATIVVLVALDLRCFHWEESAGSVFIYTLFVGWLPYLILSLAFRISILKIDTIDLGSYVQTTTHYASADDKEADPRVWDVAIIVICIGVCLLKIVNVQPLMFLMDDIRCVKCP